jgi:hypothetical protein
MMVFVDEFSNFFIIFCVLLELSGPKRSSPSTDTQLASKHECQSKTAIQPKKMFSKILTKHFKAFGSEFTELHEKLDAGTLPDFGINRRQN